MRLTVGPLSPNVYWRRRVVVLAGVLALVLIIAYSCSGSDEPGKTPTGNPGSSGTPTTATTEPLPTVISPNASDPSSGVPINPGNQGGGVTGAGAGETCADTELLVTAAAENPSVRLGVPVTFFIRIKNVSTRECSRDLSAQAQELYLEQDSAKQWSSDACSNPPNTADVRRMVPSSTQQFMVPWNGQGTAQGCTNRQLLKAGTYQLRARLGNIISEPVTVTISA